MPRRRTADELFEPQLESTAMKLPWAEGFTLLLSSKPLKVLGWKKELITKVACAGGLRCAVPHISTKGGICGGAVFVRGRAADGPCGYF
jgi:hypothetical protein